MLVLQIKNFRLSEVETAKLFFQIINGVEYLHNNKIVHRDIKPEHILLTAKGVPKLANFYFSNFQR
jgi:serine/threonine protein kinase